MKYIVHKFFIILLLLTGADFLLCGTCTGEDGENIKSFRIGFSRSLFTNVNENDAKASIRAWAKAIADEYSIDADPTARILTNFQDIHRALINRQIDSIALQFEEYLDISGNLETEHWFLTQTSGKLYEKYVLLAPVNGKIKRFDDLKGKNLILHNSFRTSLAVYWLKSILKGRDIRYNDLETNVEITKVGNISKAVLSVFFGKVDACIVTNSGFNTMVELNPQIGRKLHVIMKSPSLIPAIFCFRKNFDSPQKEKILTAFRELHTTIAGQQVLTIFQAEALVEVKETDLLTTKNFILEARKLP
ncbi:MAG: phosphate/phosphite/phosphonate ABC transporter substrate-binding protein [Desulfobacter sp.]|nr:phosphate/phosphite/phosphonate ABC transporter substrate-binding protein [Desulfobacter sp.]